MTVVPKLNFSDLKSWELLKRYAADVLQNNKKQVSPKTKIISFNGVKFDITNQLIDEDILAGLVSLANERGIDEKIKKLISGSKINKSENRAAFHINLRSPHIQENPNLNEAFGLQIARMSSLERSINSGQRRGFNGKPFTDLVQIGIGGSHLGTKLLVEVLESYAISHLKVHFISNIDPAHFSESMKNLNPETTFFVVVSKSFGTQETQVNFESAKFWFSERTNKPESFHKHCIAVTENLEAAERFGINRENTFAIPKEVGGRYSIWSAGSIAALIYLGSEVFLRFLDGATKADEHFTLEKDKKINIPILSSLISLWNYNLLGSKSQVILAYNEKLKPLVDYLQQLEMESNGKSSSVDNEPIEHSTLPIIWGGVGTSGQHSYLQNLHQGTNLFSACFYLVAQSEEDGLSHHQNWLLANALAQSTTLRKGIRFNEQKELYRTLRGNHPSSTILLEKITPSTIGTLLALQEHKVFCEGVLWDINPFDQWGVEQGKAVAKEVYKKINDHFTNSKEPFYDSYHKFVNK